MKINSKTIFPHPILRSDFEEGGIWYEKGDFKLHIEADSKLENINIIVDIDQSELAGLVKKKEATVMAIIECVRTSFRRRVELSYGQKNNFSFNRGSFKSLITVKGYISLLKDVRNFTSSSISKKITDTQKYFNISKGDLLAISQEYELLVEDEKLNSDYWQFVPRNRKENEPKSDLIEVELENNIAEIHLDPEMFEIVDSLRGKYENSDKQGLKLLMMTIYLSSFQAAIQKIIDEVSDYSEKDWFKALKREINIIKENESLSDDIDAYSLAQKVLQNPYSQLKNFDQSNKES
jgi:hypothetical protein